MSVGFQTIEEGPRNRRRESRSMFIPGFIVGFLLVAALTLAIGLVAIGVDSNSIAQLRGNQSDKWNPPPIPTTDSSAESTRDQDSAELGNTGSVQEVRRNITSSLVNIRSTPGYLGKSSSDVVGQIAPGEEVKILDGPQEADGLTWWYVRAGDGARSLVGWIAEATGSGVQILGE